MSLYASVSKFALAAGAVLLCAGCTGRKEVALAAKDDTIRNQESLIAQEKADNDKLHAENQQLGTQNNTLAEKNVEATRALTAQEAATTQQLAEIRQKDAERDALLKSLNDKLVANGGSTSSQKDGIHLTVAGSALFDSGKAELKGSAGSVLKEIAHILKTKYPNNYIRIEGHTDSTPIVHSKEKFKDNMELSMARARSVYAYMAKECGINGSKMYTAGYGEHQPLVHPEKTAADRAKNRRVEIVIMPANVKVEKDQLAQASTKTTHK